MTSPSMLALANFTPSPAPMIDPPELGETLAPWQAERVSGYTRYSTGNPLSIVMVYGTVARLWTPPTRLTLDEMLTMDTPLTRLEAWFRALPPEVHANIEESAIIAAELLHDGLERINDASVPLAAAWLRERDEMESVAVALTWIGRGSLLLTDLARIDAEARTYASTWCHEAAEITACEHLRAVSWQEPDGLVGSIVGQCQGVRG